MGVLVLIGVIAFGLWTALVYHAGGENELEKYKAKQAEAQRTISEQARKISDQQQNHIDDMQAAYEAGEAQAKTVTKTIYVKGQDYVRTQEVFRNVDCSIPADGVRILNTARAAAAMPDSEAAGILGFPVPSAKPPASGGAKDGGVVLTEPGGRSAVGGVHPQVQPSGGGAEVPAAGVQRPPKPTPAGSK